MTNPKTQAYFPINSSPPTYLLPWLTYRESLTERLQEKALDIHLQLLKQQWGIANWWDRQVLHIKENRVLHREIIMWAQQEACWYARTIIPERTYLTDEKFFKRLKNESLGTLIFNEEKINRRSLLHYPINQCSIEYHWLDKACLQRKNEILWVRKSIFTINDSPFFLIEILLPPLERYSN